MGKRKVIVLILFLALVLRLIAINQPLWLDEAISALAARDSSYLGLIKEFPLSDTHPPFHYLTLKAWAQVFGFSEISLRLLSVILGVFTVWIIYLIGKKLLGEKMGVVSALLLATSPLHIYYSQEVRMYSLTALLVSACVFFFLRIREKNAKPVDWLMFSFSLFLIAISDYLPLLILLVFAIYAVIKEMGRRWWKNFILSLVPAVIFLIVWFPIFSAQTQGTRLVLQKFSQWTQVLGGGSFKDLALVWVKFIIGRISFDERIIYAAVVFVASAPFLYLFINSLKHARKVLVFWLWFIVPLAIAFAGSWFVPGFSYFRMIFVLPAFYILVVHGGLKGRFSRLVLSAVLLANLAFSFIYLSQEKFWREDWRGAVSFIEERIGKNEIVLISFPEPFAAYRWYSKRPELAIGKGVGDYSPALSEVQKERLSGKNGAFTLDYLMDLTDPGRKTFTDLKDLGFSEREIYSFRGVGQIRHWVKG